MSEDGQNKAEGAPAAAAAAGTMDVFQALQQVLKTALIHDGVARGLRECVKALDRREAHLCVLASNCDEPNYLALVRALCDEHKIKLIKVPESKQLGEWVGLCKIDDEGTSTRRRADFFLLFLCVRAWPFKRRSHSPICTRTHAQAMRARLCRARAPSSRTLARTRTRCRFCWVRVVTWLSRFFVDALV